MNTLHEPQPVDEIDQANARFNWRMGLRLAIAGSFLAACGSQGAEAEPEVTPDVAPTPAATAEPFTQSPEPTAQPTEESSDEEPDVKSAESKVTSALIEEWMRWSSSPGTEAPDCSPGDRPAVTIEEDAEGNLDVTVRVRNPGEFGGNNVIASLDTTNAQGGRFVSSRLKLLDDSGEATFELPKDDSFNGGNLDYLYTTVTVTPPEVTPEWIYGLLPETEVPAEEGGMGINDEVIIGATGIAGIINMSSIVKGQAPPLIENPFPLIRICSQTALQNGEMDHRPSSLNDYLDLNKLGPYAPDDQLSD